MQKRASWFGTRISKSFVGSATVAELDELLLDPVDELVELSLELRMTVCDELLTSLREFEELEAIHEELDPSTGSGTLELLLDPIAALQDDEIVESVEDDDVGASTDDDTATVADDDVGALRDELLTSLREFEELEAIHEELIKFSDCALNILSELSSEQATKSSEQIGKILYKFTTKPLTEYMDELV